MDEWKQETLDAHNKYRANHGAPPLEWSDEGYDSAKKQAEACSKSGKLGHGFCEGASGRHGQNAYFHSADGKAQEAVTAWYDEIDDPGYDFKKPGFTSGTGHFTQVVWVETTHVGMAKSDCGKFVIANYLPAGNMTMPGWFEKNVLPPNSDMVTRAPPPAIGSVVATEWNDEVAAALNGCPMPQFKEKVEAALKDGAQVTLEREAASLKISIKKGNCTSSMSGSWG